MWDSSSKTVVPRTPSCMRGRCYLRKHTALGRHLIYASARATQMKKKSDQAATVASSSRRLPGGTAVSRHGSGSEESESMTRDWISEADAASRFATNMRVRDDPIAFASLSTSARQSGQLVDGRTFYHIRPSIYLAVH